MAAAGMFILWILARLTDKNTEQDIVDREKAIDEWEKKWGRKHPSRK